MVNLGVIVQWQQDKKDKEAREETEGKSDIMLLFDDNKMKMTRKPGKKRKENPVACTGEDKR